MKLNVSAFQTEFSEEKYVFLIENWDFWPTPLSLHKKASPSVAHFIYMPKHPKVLSNPTLVKI